MPSVNADTVLNAIRAFNDRGLATLVRRSSHPKVLHFALPTERDEAAWAILHESSRTFGKERSPWPHE
jgi:hypothetical protein